MKKRILAALLALAANGALAAATEFDVSNSRLLISSNTIWNNVAGSNVSGPFGNSTLGNIRMYYDASDTNYGYASAPNYWNYNWSAYLQTSSALGPLGPLGYAGPLSSIGPLGTNSYSWSPSSWLPNNYSAWMGSNVWNGSAAFGSGSPYGPSGPLGYNGPLTTQALYTTMYHLNEVVGSSHQEQSSDYNDFPHQLDPSGVWGILGPAGPLGALGPLGPLGKLGYGSSGYVTVNSTAGDFQSGGVTARSLMVQHDNNAPATYRIYDFSEIYPRANLISRQANPSSFRNDTSFSVDAVSASCTLSYSSTANHTYYFQSKYEQFVSLVLTNANAYAELDFDVYIKADTSDTFKTSTDAAAWFGTPTKKFGVDTASALWYGYTVGYQDFATFRVKKNEVIKVVVKAPYGTGYDSCGYHLHVTGTGFQTQAGTGGTPSDSTLFAPRRTSASGYPTFNVTGYHQEALSW
ncbi:MAG: hypothetical protein HYS18_13230 [Burkholderiales bacterium]|nr:hypothetical protein [Burkholderiales bacterium]